MRWLIRRSCFYAVRVVGCDHAELPVAAAHAGRSGRRHAGPAQPVADPVEPGHHRDLPADAGRRERVAARTAYFSYLGQIATLDFGISTSNYPTNVSEVIARTLPVFDLPRRRRLHPRVRARHDDRHDRGLAPRRRGRQHRGADAALAERVPRLLHVARRRLLLRPQARLVPAPARLRHRARARLQLHVPGERVPPRAAADPRDHGRVRRRLGAQHAHRHDQHDRGGLRGDGPGQGPARPARDDALRRAQRHPAAAQRLRRAVRDRRRRPRLHRVRVQLPGRRLHAAAGRAGQRLPAHAGAAARVRGLRDRRQLHHGPAQPRPRPARARELGGTRVADAAGRRRRGRAGRRPSRCAVQRARARARRRLPGLPLWLRLLLHNPKSCIGLIVLGAMVAVAIFAPLIATHDPTAYSLLDAKQSPSLHHFFGTTDQGTDVFSQVVLGTRNSLFLGAAAATLATLLAASLGILAAYSGGWVDDVINFATNVFLVIPTIPLLIVASAYLKNRGATSMILILGLTLWAFEARILRGQALTLRNRDFILAAKVAGEPTWRIVLFELMPNMISRIAAAFVLVFYVSILTAAGLEFLGPRRPQQPELGRDALLGAGQLDRAAGRVVAVPLPGPLPGAHGRGARADPGRPRRGLEPAPAQVAQAARHAQGPALRTRAQPVSAVATKALLELDHLSVDYVLDDRRVRAVDDVSLSIAPGEILGLAGESGCGKSTLASAVLQILKPPAEVSGGRILFQGADLVAMGPRGAAPRALAPRLARLPERDERPQPRHARRRPVRRHVQGPRPHPPQRGAGARGRSARARRHRPQARALLPARALGRHAPARRDRDGARARARADRHGRADDRARRGRAARDPAGARGAQAAPRLRRALHHARPLAAGRVQRSHRDHVRGRDRRVRAPRTCSSGTRCIRTRTAS